MAGGRRDAPQQSMPDGFTEQAARVGDVMINYVRGGSGEPLVLLHGYPQNWYMWRKVLPELARHRTVIAPDLRGAGGSDAPTDGYDKKTLAGDIYGLLSQLGFDDGVDLVGHDVGAMVAYAYAARYPGQVRRLVLAEAPIPDESVYRLPALTNRGPGVWNFGFFTVDNGLPEQMVAGREETWVDRFVASMAVHPERVDGDAIEAYARSLRDEAHLRASFGYFRALPDDVDDNAEYARTKLSMPVLAIGAKASLADSVALQAARYATDVTEGVIEDCGHWLFEEQPEELTQRVLEFIG